MYLPPVSFGQRTQNPLMPKRIAIIRFPAAHLKGWLLGEEQPVYSIYHRLPAGDDGPDAGHDGAVLAAEPLVQPALPADGGHTFLGMAQDKARLKMRHFCLSA